MDFDQWDFWILKNEGKPQILKTWGEKNKQGKLGYSWFWPKVLVNILGEKLRFFFA